MEDGRDGVRISTVINVDVDPTGWLPDFVLKSIAKEDAKTAENMVELVR